jgi:hypothetical protein
MIQNVSATDTGYGTRTLETWDSYTPGAKSGGNAYCTWNIVSDISSNGVYLGNYMVSSPKSMFLGKPTVNDNAFSSELWLNLANTYTYIHDVSIAYKMSLATSNGVVTSYMYFYNGTSKVIEIKSQYAWIGPKDTEIRDHTGSYNTICNNIDGNVFLNISHYSENIINVTIDNSGTKYYYNGTTYMNGTGGINYYTFDRIYFKVSTSGASNNHGTYYFDDMVITTAGYGAAPGSLSVNAYDEVSGVNISNFSLMITNQIGGTFFADGLNNTFTYPSTFLPQGANTMVTIYATGYYPRNYLVDIYNGYFYVDGIYYSSATINAYLPQVNSSYLYQLTVNDLFQYPIADVTVIIKGLCGNASYEKLYDVMTDGAGQTSVYFIPGQLYQVTLNKTGYQTRTENYIPSSTVFTKTFVLAFYIPEQQPIVNPYDIITFRAYFNTGNNNTLYVNFSDSSLNTTNGYIEIYENQTLIINLSLTTYTLNYSNATRNHTRYDYRIDLHIINHLNIFNYSDQINIPRLFSRPSFILGIPGLASIGATNPLGWVNCIVFFFSIYILCTPGRRWAGIGIAGIGGVLWIFEVLIGLNFNAAQYAAIPFFILFGALVQLSISKLGARI